MKYTGIDPTPTRHSSSLSPLPPILGASQPQPSPPLRGSKCIRHCRLSFSADLPSLFFIALQNAKKKEDEEKKLLGVCCCARRCLQVRPTKLDITDFALLAPLCCCPRYRGYTLAALCMEALGRTGRDAIIFYCGSQHDGSGG